MRSLDYFAKSPVAPLFEVRTVYADVNHIAFESLNEDLNNISDEKLSWYQGHGEFKHLLSRSKSKTDLKLDVIIILLESEIARLRIKALLRNDDFRPNPYQHPALTGINLDKNFLVNHTDFDAVSGGFAIDNEVFTILPSTDVINSSYWVLDILNSLDRNDLIKIRLDPLIHQPATSFNPLMFKMQVYGTKLDWDRIKNLKIPEHTQFIPEFPSSKDILRTDLIWTPVDDEIHFTCEEMPVISLIDQRGSRYFHSIIEKQTGFIKHCDGAIRYYTEEEYNKRVDKHVRANEVTRIGRRIKVFQIDVPKLELPAIPITHKNFIDIVTNFFVWNYDVYDYFNPDEK